MKGCAAGTMALSAMSTQETLVDTTSAGKDQRLFYLYMVLLNPSNVASTPFNSMQ
jgi:hypothetical protein